jgi:hypothetical protein
MTNPIVDWNDPDRMNNGDPDQDMMDDENQQAIDDSASVPQSYRLNK